MCLSLSFRSVRLRSDQRRELRGTRREEKNERKFLRESGWEGGERGYEEVSDEREKERRGEGQMEKKKERIVTAHKDAAQNTAEKDLGTVAVGALYSFAFCSS